MTSTDELKGMVWRKWPVAHTNLDVRLSQILWFVSTYVAEVGKRKKTSTDMLTIKH